MSDINNTPADRTLDIAIAEALGHIVAWFDIDDGEGHTIRHPVIENIGYLPQYSTDLNEAITLFRPSWRLFYRGSNWFVANYESDITTVGASAAEAIANAAITAFEFKTRKDNKNESDGSSTETPAEPR